MPNVHTSLLACTDLCCVFSVGLKGKGGWGELKGGQKGGDVYNTSSMSWVEKLGVNCTNTTCGEYSTGSHLVKR